MTGGVDSLALHPRQTSGLPSPFAFYSRPLRASLSWLSRCSRQLSVVRVSRQDSVQSFAHSDFNAAVRLFGTRIAAAAPSLTPPGRVTHRGFSPLHSITGLGPSGSYRAGCIRKGLERLRVFA